MEPLAVSVKEAARIVGVSRSRLYELIGSGQVEARKIGSRTIIPTDSLRALVADAPEKQAA
jgi:excisionase family DNA binding protein